MGVKQHSYGYLEGPGSFKQILRFLSQEELMQGQRGPQAQMEQVAAGFSRVTSESLILISFVDPFHDML